MWNYFRKSAPVAPPLVATDRIVPLSQEDDTQINRDLILNFMMRFDSVLDAEKLYSALERLLNRPDWKKLGARLRLNVCRRVPI